MAFEDCVVADSDLHVMEPPDLWQRYIDPAFRHAAPVGLSEMKRDMRVRVKNHVLLRMGSVRPMKPAPEGAQRGEAERSRRTGWRKEHEDVYAASEARGWDAQSQLDAMDAEGISPGAYDRAAADGPSTADPAIAAAGISRPCG